MRTASPEQETDRRERQRSSLLFGRRNSFNSMSHHRFTTRLKKRMNIRMEALMLHKMNDHRFTLHQTTTLPKPDALPKLVFKSSFRPPNSSDDLSLLFCVFLLQWQRSISGFAVSIPALVFNNLLWLKRSNNVFCLNNSILSRLMQETKIRRSTVEFYQYMYFIL